MTKVEVKTFNEEDWRAKYERERKEKLDNFPTKAENFKKKLKELKVKSFSVEYSGSGQSGNIDWNSKDNTIRHEYVSLVEEQYSEGF